MEEGHSMNVRDRSSRVIRLNVEGRLVMDAAPSLSAVISGMVGTHPVVVLIGLAGTTDLDAHGIGELVAARKELERHGGRMALVAPSAGVLQLLSITNLDSVFTICNSELEALVRLAPMKVAAALLRTSGYHVSHFDRRS
jgi:anti-anti-sigma factor